MHIHWNIYTRTKKGNFADFQPALCCYNVGRMNNVYLFSMLPGLINSCLFVSKRTFDGQGTTECIPIQGQSDRKRVINIFIRVIVDFVYSLNRIMVKQLSYLCDGVLLGWC